MSGLANAWPELGFRLMRLPMQNGEIDGCERGDRAGQPGTSIPAAKLTFTRKKGERLGPYCLYAL